MKLKRELVYFALVTLASIVALFKTGLVAYVLTPENFGYFTLFLVITGYFQYSQMGILNGLGRELPISYGKDYVNNSLELVGLTVKALILSQFSFLIICFIAISLISFDDKKMYLVISLALLASIVSNFYNLSTLRLRSELRIIEYSLVNFVVVVFGLGLTVYFAMRMEYLGAILGTIISSLLGFLYTNLFILDKPIFNIQEGFHKAKDLMMMGSPMLLAGLIQTTLFSLDKIFLLNIYSIEDLGIYGFSSIPLTMGIVMSGILATFFTPKILHEFGSKEDLLQAFRHSRNISLIVILAGITLYPIYYLIIDFIINNLFPDYLESKELMAIFYIPALFIAANLFGPFLMAAKKFSFFIYYEFSLLFCAGVMYSLIIWGNLEIIFFPYTLAAISTGGFTFLFFYSRRLAYNNLASK